MCVAPSVFVDARRRDALGQVVSGGSESEQLLGALDVGLGQLGRARHATGHLRRLLLQVVAQTGLLAADLAGAGHAEALGGATVRLVLGHLVGFLLLVTLRSRGRGSRNACAPSSARVRRGRRGARRAPRPARPRERLRALPPPPSPRPWPRTSSCAAPGP